MIEKKYTPSTEITPELHEWLRATAETEKRSMSQQLVLILESAKKESEKQ